MNLEGKLAVITGGNSGIGLEAGVQLAAQGCSIVICSRSIEKGEKARQDMIKRSGVKNENKISLVQLDLADLDNISTFRSRYDVLPIKNQPIDMLILNAGVMAIPRELTKQGFESQMATNCYGHFKFTSVMFDLCLKSQHSRIVSVSSGGHKMPKKGITFNDLNREKSYDKWQVYGETKLGNLLFMTKLNRILIEKKIDNVIVVGCHPGLSSTNLADHMKDTFLVKYLLPILAQSAEMGAKPTVLAATDPKAVRNGYACPKSWFEAWGEPKWNGVLSSFVTDEKQQDQFWKACEDATQIHHFGGFV